MRLIDVVWNPYVNLLIIRCDCGIVFQAWSRFSLAACPACGKAELWHDVAPKPETGSWSEPVMANVVPKIPIVHGAT